MRSWFFTFLIAALCTFGISRAEKHEHKHSEEAEADHHDEGEEHEHGEEEEEHAEGEHGHHGEGEHEEEASAVGPEKGILEKGKEGFKLAPEAIASFGMKTAKVTSASSLPKEALVKVKAKKYVYRLQNGWIKKIAPNQVKIGDEIIVQGTGYVRTAELVVLEGLAGHEH